MPLGKGSCTGVGSWFSHGTQYTLAERWDGKSWTVRPPRRRPGRRPYSMACPVRRRPIASPSGFTPHPLSPGSICWSNAGMGEAGLSNPSQNPPGRQSPNCMRCHAAQLPVAPRWDSPTRPVALRRRWPSIGTGPPGPSRRCRLSNTPPDCWAVCLAPQPPTALPSAATAPSVKTRACSPSAGTGSRWAFQMVPNPAGTSFLLNCRVMHTARALHRRRRRLQRHSVRGIDRRTRERKHLGPAEGRRPGRDHAVRRVLPDRDRLHRGRREHRFRCRGRRALGWD